MRDVEGAQRAGDAPERCLADDNRNRERVDAFETNEGVVGAELAGIVDDGRGAGPSVDTGEHDEHHRKYLLHDFSVPSFRNYGWACCMELFASRRSEIKEIAELANPRRKLWWLRA